tara:strand:+ start:43136 stop:43513 length:378 start_codon:yes stop_codon:yes gene_type:complete
MDVSKPKGDIAILHRELELEALRKFNESLPSITPSPSDQQPSKYTNELFANHMRHLPDFVLSVNDDCDLFPLAEDHEKLEEITRSAMKIKTLEDFNKFVLLVEDFDVVDPRNFQWEMLKAVANLK